MRLHFLIILLCLTLCGCASSQPEATAEADHIPTAPPTETTVPETTIPETEPWDPVQKLVDAMSTEEKVGQLFLARCPGETAVSDIEKFHLGGFVLFGRDIHGQTPDSLRQKLWDFQAASPIGMLMAVDEEGGTVCRISCYSAFRSQKFLSPRRAYADGGMEAVLAAEREKGRLLSELGINVNLSPVCDIATDSGAFMYDRSLGQSPEETGRFVSGTVGIMDSFQIGSVLKHFPGYGNNTDTHTGIARDTRPLELLENADLLPFAAGMEAGCGAVMVSHIIVEALDAELPATLSPAVHQYLRQSMGFDGVIITDDLAMQGITDLYPAGESAVLAILAGSDMLCSTDYAQQYDAILDAVNTGRISMEQLDQAVYRILTWKQKLGLIF